MLTGYQRQLFSDLISLNWEIDHGNYPSVVKNALVEQYWKVKEELMGDMGKGEYENYINGMRQLFAPAGGYGDESPEEVADMIARVS
jgi:hypothetical protein